MIAVGVGGATAIWWGEARAAAEYPATHEAAPTAKNYPTPNANSAETKTLIRAEACFVRSMKPPWRFALHLICKNYIRIYSMLFHSC